MFMFLFLFGLALGTVSPSDELPLSTVSPSDELPLVTVSPSDELPLGTVVLETKKTLSNEVCPPFWQSFKRRCYKYVSTHFTWADAEVNCVSENANLVSIHSYEEQDFITTLIRNFDPENGFTWIGLSDTHKEDAWMWSDGSAVDYTAWNADEPSNYGGNEDCVHTNYEGALKWNDRGCSETFPSICVSRKTCP